MNRLDKLKAEIAEMDAGELAGLLDNETCQYCICQPGTCDDNCRTNMTDYLKQEIKLPKTLADVFFERNPGAEKECFVVQPKCCAKQVGLINDCPCANCADCWNRPYEEEKGSAE